MPAHLKKGVLQIVFNKISAAEVSSIPTLEQLDLLGDFQVSESTLQTLDDARFGKMEKDGKILYRYVARDYRIYFEVIEGKVVVHRVLHANSLNDFLFRTNISPTAGEDEILSQSKHFWKLIDEGKKASKA
ncbi:hypothetical protein [Akkermansia sp.]|uniref:hypothetical protein n=1 Tax=Akkermansia sp. TaxID=1872421 RepID=UPI0025C03C98|nr:hypothetical protein [Akkermansia sp.]MCD8064411.1 hypothetical protein [Akkermansia sp.]